MIAKDLKKTPQQFLRRRYRSILQVLFANLAAVHFEVSPRQEMSFPALVEL
jgi:hypothetical protein